MNFKELGVTLRKFLSKKIAIEKKYAEDVASLNERFKGDFLTARLAERKAERDSELYALQSGLKADIEAVRAEKIKLTDTAAATAPTTDMMNLLTALNLRKSVSKAEILAVAEAVQGNYHALAVLRDVAKNKGYNIDVTDIEQTKQRIDEACNLALRAVNDELNMPTEASMYDRDGMIWLYNETEKQRTPNSTYVLVSLNGQIHGYKDGDTVWDHVTQGLDDGFVRTPEVVKALSPGETKIVERMFDGVPADKLRDTVNQRARESKETRELIALSDYADLLETEA